MKTKAFYKFIIFKENIFVAYRDSVVFSEFLGVKNIILKMSKFFKFCFFQVFRIENAICKRWAGG